MPVKEIGYKPSCTYTACTLDSVDIEGHRAKGDLYLDADKKVQAFTLTLKGDTAFFNAMHRYVAQKIERNDEIYAVDTIDGGFKWGIAGNFEFINYSIRYHRRTIYITGAAKKITH
jgi:hypothetical protein